MRGFCSTPGPKGARLWIKDAPLHPANIPKMRA
jgi:hypothetical protein